VPIFYTVLNRKEIVFSEKYLFLLSSLPCLPSGRQSLFIFSFLNRDLKRLKEIFLFLFLVFLGSLPIPVKDLITDH